MMQQKRKSGMNNSDEDSTHPLQYFFQVDLVLLRMLGLSSFRDVFTSDKLNSLWWDRCCLIIGVSLVSSIALAEIATIFYVWHDLNYVIEIVASLGTIILSTIKGVRLWTHRQILFNLLRRFDSLWENARSNKFLTTEVIEAAENVTFIRKIYSITVILAGVSYTLRPCISLLHYQLHPGINDSFDFTVSVFPTTYPFTVQSFRRFLIFTSYQQIAAVTICLYWISSDTLFAQFMTHTSIQFTILANRMENIIVNDHTGKAENNIELQLKDIANQHYLLFTLCWTMETYFNPIIFLTVLSNGINLCCCLFRMDQQLGDSDWNELAKNLSHLMSLLIQTVIYCGYAEILTQSSARIYSATYHSEWMRFNRVSKVMLLMIMTRATKEYNFRVYGMIALNLTRVTMIVNGAVSYFVLLKNVS